MFVRFQCILVRTHAGLSDVRHTQRLDQIDERLRGVEAGIAELQGRKAGFTLLKDWVVAICAIAALIVSIIALTH